MSQPVILVVEDDPQTRKSLKHGLLAEGYRVLEAWDRTTMFASLEAHNASIVTLDLNLDGENGLDLALEMRSKWNIPVIMISGRTEPYDRVRGLECGADDYIVKPFHIREVALRISKTLERYRESVKRPSKVLFDHCILDLKQKVARHLDGSTLDLTEMEMKLLELFVCHPSRVLTRDEISNALYGRDWSPYDRTIDGHVARLRSKIEPPGEAPLLIRTVRGVGYVFNGEVIPAADQN
jgi:two-component system OmpR family response regulator